MGGWVDVAQIISALATSLALIFVARATRHSRQTVEESQRMRRLESERDDRAIAVAERRQASRIVCWPVRGEVAGKVQWGIELINASDAPVFGLSVHRSEGMSRKGTSIPEIRATAKILPPGRYFVPDRQRWPVYVQQQAILEPVPGNADYMPAICFMDSDGRSWVRGADGQLGDATASRTGSDVTSAPASAK
ncbi:hypothetical protein [Arthrobacter sp. NA-172]|uniref:hypothetical protein n=1 Tax=Arthrobacter sp. NA-172 TaxID=3367524 RepID=UPI003754B023